MMPNAERRGKTNKEPTKNETQMNSLKKLLLAAALLMSGACVVNAQEKTTTAGVPVVELNNGVEMPRFGLGTFLQGSNEVCKQSCLTALRTGYRHIDTAHAYNDEEGVGQAVKESGIPRSEIWITSKLWPTEYGEGKTLRAIDAMLDRTAARLHRPALRPPARGRLSRCVARHGKGRKDGQGARPRHQQL